MHSCRIEPSRKVALSKVHFFRGRRNVKNLRTVHSACMLHCLLLAWRGYHSGTSVVWELSSYSSPTWAPATLSTGKGTTRALDNGNVICLQMSSENFHSAQSPRGPLDLVAIWPLCKATSDTWVATSQLGNGHDLTGPLGVPQKDQDPEPLGERLGHRPGEPRCLH